MPDQRGIGDMGGTMRLGLSPCRLVPGAVAAGAYAAAEVSERHRHRFEFNNTYREILGGRGMVFSGLSPDGRLVEIAELEGHPFMLGSQFHPEFLSRPNRAHPLFRGLLEAATAYAGRPAPPGKGERGRSRSTLEGLHRVVERPIERGVWALQARGSVAEQHPGRPA